MYFIKIYFNCDKKNLFYFKLSFEKILVVGKKKQNDYKDSKIVLI